MDLALDNLQKLICHKTQPTNQPISLVGRVFTNGLGGWSSILVWVIPKTQKMDLDASLLNNLHYNVCIKDKMEQSREWSSTHTPLHLSVVGIEKGTFESSLTTVANFTYKYILFCLWATAYKRCGVWLLTFEHVHCEHKWFYIIWCTFLLISRNILKRIRISYCHEVLDRQLSCVIEGGNATTVSSWNFWSVFL